MKALKITILAIISFFVFTAYTYSDMGQHFRRIKYSVIISNIDEFPGISFIADFHPLKQKAQLLKQNEPLDFKFMSIRKERIVYALKTSYIKGKDLNTIHFPSDPNCIKMSEDIKFNWDRVINIDESIKELMLVYTILGFRNGKLIIYKSKEIEKYGFFTPNKTITFEKPDTTGIVKNID